MFGLYIPPVFVDGGYEYQNFLMSIGTGRGHIHTCLWRSEPHSHLNGFPQIELYIPPMAIYGLCKYHGFQISLGTGGVTYLFMEE